MRVSSHIPYFIFGTIVIRCFEAHRRQALVGGLNVKDT